MRVGAVVRLCLVSAAFCGTPVLPAQSEGLPPEWEIRKDLEALVEQTRRLSTPLATLKPADWVGRGAPAAYQGQLQSVRAENEYLAGSAAKLAKDPEQLTVALETYLRMQSRDALLNSLSDGVARYQNPALADLIRAAMAESAASGEKLRQYLVRLAALKEEQLKVANQEAQRCRALTLQQLARKEPGKPGGAR